ncbi:MAG: AI-2E family transporter [Mycobacterium leprae]
MVEVDPGVVSPPPSVLPRGLIVLLGLAATVVTVAGLRGVAGILGPVFLALMLTIAVHPMLGWARRRHIPVWAATVGTLATVYVGLFALAGSLAVSVARLATLLPTYGDQANAVLGNVATFLARQGVGEDEVRRVLGQVDFGRLVGLAGNLLVDLLGVFSDLFFILVVLLFMGLDAAGFPARLRAAAGERPDLVAALVSFARGTRRYLVVSTVFGLIVAIIDVGALWLLGIPLAVLWGILAFITNYIPNVGFIVGLVPPALLGLLEGGPRLMLAVIAAYSLINFVIQSVIQPKFVGDSVGLSTTLTFLSLVVWSWIIGPLGALLAIPLTLLTKALLVDIDPATRWLSSLIGPGPTAVPVTVPRAGDRDGDTDQPPFTENRPAPRGNG